MIAINYRSSIINESGLIESMKESPILVVIIFDGKEAKYRLALAKEIFINDDTEYQQIFNPLTAPINDKLKVLYKVFLSYSLILQIYCI